MPPWDSVCTHIHISLALSLSQNGNWEYQCLWKVIVLTCVNDLAHRPLVLFLMSSASPPDYTLTENRNRSFLSLRNSTINENNTQKTYDYELKTSAQRKSSSGSMTKYRGPLIIHFFPSLENFTHEANVFCMWGLK